MKHLHFSQVSSVAPRRFLAADSIRVITLIALGVAFGWGPWTSQALVFAQRPAAPQLLPDTTMVYFRIGDAQETFAKLQETSLGRMINDPQIQPIFQHLYGSALDAYQQIQDEVGLELAELLSIPQGELCVALVAPPQGTPTLAVMIDVKDRMAEAEKLIDRAFEEAGFRGTNLRFERHGDTDISILGGGNGRPPLAICTRDGLVLITSDAELSKAILDVWQGKADVNTLADNRKFTTIMRQSVGTREERPQASWYVDPIGLFRSATRGNVGAAVALALLEPLGLNGLEAMGGSFILAAEEFDTITHFHLLLKHPREGVLKMLAMQPGDTKPEYWIPKEVASYTTMNWDFNTTFGELAEMYDVIRLEEGAFTEWVQQNVSNRLGADVQNEVLPELEGRVTLLSWIQRPIRLNSEATALGLQLRSGERFRPILEKIVEHFPEQVSKENIGTFSYYRLSPLQESRNEFEEEMIRAPEPCLLLMDDYLILSNSRKLLERIIETRGRSGSSLADDLEYKLVASKIQRHSGGREPGLASFSRPEENFRALYELATAEATQNRLNQAGESNQVVGALGGALSAHPLPPFEVISKYLAPAGSMMFSDSTGFHYISFGLRRD
jgi:hypothetical protein